MDFVFLVTMATAIIVNAFRKLICCCNLCLCKMRPEEMVKIVALHDDGRSMCYIANALNFAKSTAHDSLRRFQESGSYNRRPGSGRKRSTTEGKDGFILLCVLRDRPLISNIIAQRLRNSHGFCKNSL